MGGRDNVLEVRGLRSCYFCDGGEAAAVDGVSLAIGRGETFALVGESGCGKSTIALAIMGLIDRDAGRVVGGEVMFGGEDLLGLSEKRMRGVRGGGIGMIFQEPGASLNPVFCVGEQVAEAVRVHKGKGRRAAWEEAVGLLERVGIADAAVRARDYPHQFSGGMQQRVMIAMAISCGPELLIADEATAALDVTTQRVIGDLINDLKGERGMSVLLITHDIAVAGEWADEIAVMYAGRIVESGRCGEVLEGPMHPYTRGLIDSMPRAGQRRLRTIGGRMPGLGQIGDGCRFRDRCVRGADDEGCGRIEPELRDMGGGRWVACRHVEGKDDE